MQQSTHSDVDEELEEADADEDLEEADADEELEEVDTDRDPEEADADEDPEEVDMDEDPEEADTEEEADYRYVDDFEIEGEDNNLDLVSKDLENDDNNEYDVLWGLLYIHNVTWSIKYMENGICLTLQGKDMRAGVLPWFAYSSTTYQYRKSTKYHESMRLR